jgi:hypothetical protein
MMAAAEVKAASGRLAEASKAFEDTRADARLHGYVEYELETQLRLNEIEIKLGHFTIGRSRLRQLQDDARAKGFLLLANKAAAAAI